MNVLVTGSEGYIGSVLVQQLLKAHYKVTGFDTDFYYHDLLGSKASGYTFVKGDVRELNNISLKGYDAIIHLAALSNDPTGELNPQLTLDINYKATVALAKKAKKAGVKRFLFSSSCSVYGITKSGIVDETSKLAPLTIYAKSKIRAEKVLQKIADNNFSVGILRNSTVYGYSPKFRNDLVVNNFVTCGLATKKIRVMSDGSPWRPLIDVHDLADIFIAFLEAPAKKINGEVFNIGFNTNNFQVKDVLEKIHDEMPECNIEFTGEHGKDTRSYKVNFDKFSKAFPQIKMKWPLQKSIRYLIKKLEENNYSPADFHAGKYTKLTTLKSLLENGEVNEFFFWKSKKDMKCRACGSEIVDFFTLGQMPLVNSFLTKSQLVTEKKYELTTAFCPSCYLVQLNQTIPPEALFTDYIYFSSTSKTIVEHSEKTANYLTKRLSLTSKSLVAEIASNDGVLLQFFKKNGIQIVGIDPAKNIAKIANQKGIRTIAEFFNYAFAKKFVKNEKAHADLIYGANVLAHVPNIIDFAKGVKEVLATKGTAVFEFPYLQGLLENKFDTIYHEHVFYYSLIALQNLFKNVGLEIYDVEMVPMQGGSLRIFIARPNTYTMTKAVRKLVEKEKKDGYDKLETYQAMNERIIKLKKQLLALLDTIKQENKSIVGYSAPAKGLILLNFFGIGSNYLDFIVDKAKEKQGLYTPGIHMIVEPIEKIIDEQPDYVLILCWNIADEVISLLHDYQKKGGKFIIPIPQVKIV